MYESHPYLRTGVCPCKIGEEAVAQAAEIFEASKDAASFALEMQRRRVIGRRIWYDEAERTIFVTKVYACESGGGCPGNDSLIGQRCHCHHYNHSKETQPVYYCKCGAEFYRPMFAPLFGERVLIEPHKTVLAGDDECVIAVRIGRTEGGS